MKKIKFMIIGIIIILVFFIIYRLNNIANPILLVQAKETAYNYITKTVNTSVSKSIKNLDINSLFIISYDKNGEIISIDFDSIIVNRLLTDVALDIENNMSSIDEPIYDVPFGVVFKNSFLIDLGPNIPVKLKLVGSIVNNIDTKITNYGINNALLEVYINIKVNVRVALPFISDNIAVETLIPIAIKLIRGNVPEYYAGTMSSNPLLSIPIE